MSWAWVADAWHVACALARRPNPLARPMPGQPLPPLPDAAVPLLWVAATRRPVKRAWLRMRCEGIARSTDAAEWQTRRATRRSEFLRHG